MNSNRTWRELNRLLKQAEPVVGSPEWWAMKFESATSNGVLDINKLDEFDPAWGSPLDGPPEMEGDMGREWEETERDNDSRRSG